MKILLNFCCAASLLGLLTIAASNLGIAAPFVVAGKSESGVARKIEGRPAPKSSFAAPVVFNEHARSKVVQYFDTYRSEPYGLPPACAAKVRTGRIPGGWAEQGMAAGTVVPQGEREFLTEVPVELVRVLAAQSEVKVRFYLAGASLVALDAGGKVLDVVRIPTVRLDDGREPVAAARLVAFRR
ncbi:MAG: hypothetical protein ABIT37_17085 [Luteolibacter sp.]